MNVRARWRNSKKSLELSPEYELDVFLAPRDFTLVGDDVQGHGEVEGTRVLLDEALRRQKDEFVAAADIAELYLRLGQKDTALEWLEKSLEQRDFDAVWLNAHPRWDPLRDEPEFQSLLANVGFPAGGE